MIYGNMNELYCHLIDCSDKILTVKIGLHFKHSGFLFIYFIIKLFSMSKFLQHLFSFLEQLKDTKSSLKLQLNVLGLDI